MTAYDKATADRLVREAREDDERMTPAPWRCARIADDYGRIDGPGWPVAQVLHDYDERPLIDEDTAAHADGDINGIARMRNNLTTLADQLEAAGAEVERLTGCMNTAGLQCFMRGSSPAKVAEHMRSVAESWTKHDAEVTAERDALRATVEQLTESVRTAGENWMSACSQRDAARAEVERLAAAQPNWAHVEALKQRDALIASDVENRTRIRALETERDDARRVAAKDWRSGVEASILRLEAQMQKPRDLWHAAYFAALDEALIHLRAMLERGTDRSGEDCL